MTRDGGPTYRYLGRDAPTATWSTLGDRGLLDEDGYLWVIDREDDLIVSGSVTVYPIEVERMLERHPLVRSAVAFGVADAELGSRIHAMVDVAEAALTPDDLQLWLSSRLDHEKLPRVIEIVHDPLRDDAGKVRRSLLSRERAASPSVARTARN